MRRPKDILLREVAVPLREVAGLLQEVAVPLHEVAVRLREVAVHPYEVEVVILLHEMWSLWEMDARSCNSPMGRQSGMCRLVSVA
jgi:hypothetical protein